MDSEIEDLREMRETENRMIARENEHLLRKYVGDKPEDFEPLPDMPPAPNGFHGWWR
jgi:hypothetical protein